MGMGVQLDSGKARYLGSLTQDVCVDQVFVKEPGALSLRLAFNECERFVHRERMQKHHHRMPWKTLEEGIQQLREVAALEVLFERDGQHDKDPDKVRCAGQMWNLAKLGPSQYTTIIAMINAKHNQETVGSVAYRLRNYESMVNGPMHAHVSAVVKELKEEFKEEIREATNKITAMSPLTSKKETQAFLGAKGFWRMHIPEYSQNVSPLYLVTHKKNNFHWGPEQIKQKITHVVDLGPVRTGPEVKNMLYSTAGSHGLSWTLWQKVPGETHDQPLGFWSQSYKWSEVNYTPTEKEILAAYEGVQYASEVIHDCEKCAAIKQAKQVKPLWYGRQWSKYKYGEALQIDYITLPQTHQGKHYMLAMVEATTGCIVTGGVGLLLYFPAVGEPRASPCHIRTQEHPCTPPGATPHLRTAQTQGPTIADTQALIWDSRWRRALQELRTRYQGGPNAALTLTQLAGDPLEDNPAQQARLPRNVLVDIKEAARKAILQIAPAADCNEELTVLAKALRPPLTIPENMRIAKAMALPPHPLGHQVMTVIDPDHPSYNDHVEVHATWKTSGQWRLLHDLRKLNEIMEEMGPLQQGLPSLTMIPRGWPLVIIDLKDCFFSIPLHPDDAHRMAFSVPSLNREEPLERYHWVVLPQGLKNSPTICQWYVARALAPARKKYPEARIIHYMDDLLIAASTQQELQQVCDCVIEEVQKVGLEISTSKIQESRLGNTSDGKSRSKQ
ncbi:hypothetical protein TURU_008424 [Turdus rufiventris]|nr:hypothetical protein TURU_008424 [Turdus rufiventris]